MRSKERNMNGTSITRHFFFILLVTISQCIGAKEGKKDLGTVIGIDLGTTYTCVAIFKNCHVEIIENDQGNRITPTVVAFTSDGERLIGDSAKNLLTSNPENTIFHVKRLIGRKFDEPSVQQDIKNFPFSVIEKNNKPIIKINSQNGEKLFTPEEISAMVLGKMRAIAEAYLGHKVKNAVVTVPAYFNNAQREATKDAGTIAGLNVIRIINEPTAAAIAYGLDKLNSKEEAKNILVFDLGGGTFDVSILTLDDGLLEVLATNGDTHLGGEDFDQRVVDHFLKLFQTKTGKDAGKNNRSVQKLRREVEKAKRTLSSEYQAKIEVESFFENNDFSEVLTRAKFEELNSDLFQLTLKLVQNAIEDACLKKSEIADIILVGASTRIPKIRQLIGDYFNKKPSTGVNSDEAVAYGAAVQGGVLSHEDCTNTNDILLLDVNPLSLGIQLVGGVMSELIPRNSKIPIKKTERFTTTADYQHTVTIEVFEGERPMTKDNHFLGKFDLTGIPLASRGIPQIDVTFDIDANGILNVTVEEKDTGKKENIIINTKTNRLSQNEIDRMIKDAEKFADQDKQVKDRVDAKNDFESYVYSLRNQLNNESTPLGKLSSREKTTTENNVEKQIQWIDDNPNAKIEELRTHKDRLEQIATEIINEFIRRNPTANDTQPSSSSNAGEL